MASAAGPPTPGAPPSPLIIRMAEYVVAALSTPLPPAAEEAAVHHILDTLAAIVSGRRLPAGKAGASFAALKALPGVAVVIGTSQRTDPGYAALANGMAAHADESDDTHELSKSHPGSSIVPSALATAQARGRSGRDFVRAVALGYDIGTRISPALWPTFEAVRRQPRATPGISGTFGSASAAGALRGFDERQVRHLFSYAAQEVAGMNTWKRDTEHVEKAYVLGGWPAFSGLFAADVVEAGWSGVEDVFTGQPNFLDIVGTDAVPQDLVAELGTRFEVTRTHIKRHAVGSPAQAPIQALSAIVRDHQLKDADVARVVVRLPAVLAETVQKSREMPDINLQYLLSTVIARGELTFADTHDRELFTAWQSADDGGRVLVVPDPDMSSRRQALVEVTTIAGDTFSHRVDRVHGSPENPLGESDVVAKATDLMGPVLGAQRTAEVCRATLDISTASDLEGLAGLLAG